MADLDSKLRAAVEPLLEPGEPLRGVCVATQRSMFKGRQVALGVSDRRLLVQRRRPRRLAPSQPQRAGRAR